MRKRLPILFFLLWTQLMWGAEPSSERVLVVSPELTDQQRARVQRALETELGIALNFTFETYSAPLVLRPLQRSATPAQEVTCPKEVPSLSTRRTHAKDQLEYSRTTEARRELDQAIELFPCLRHPVSQRELAQVLELYALAALQEQADASMHYREALAIDPSLPAPTEIGDRAQQAHKDAQGQLDAQKKTTVKLPAGLLRDQALYLDGKKVEQETLTLLPGRHFLQFMREDGTVWYSLVARLTPDYDRPTWPDGQRLPVSQEALEKELRRAAQPSEPPSAELVQRLTGLQQATDMATVLLLDAPEKSLVTGWKIHGGTTGPVKLSLRDPRGPQRARASGIAAAVLGGVGLGFAGWGGYQYMTLHGTAVGSDEERQQLETRYAVTLGTASGGVIGGLAGLGLWWMWTKEW